jgi:hypothetical protein
MMDALPPLGAFIRPIGPTRYGYCLRVLRQIDTKEGPCIEGERWGMRDQRPLDDGHIQREHFEYLTPSLVPGVWLKPGWSRLWEEEVYFRLMQTNPAGQMELFA